MTQFSRDLTPHGSYYFNVRLKDHRSDLLTHEINALADATRKTMARYPFQIDAICILPAEILTVWTLPDGDTNTATRWSMLKSLFQNALPEWDRSIPFHLRDGENRVWQRRMSERRLRGRYDFDNHCTHIHNAAFKAGLVHQPDLWPHCSLHSSVISAFSDPAATRRMGSLSVWMAGRNGLSASG